MTFRLAMVTANPYLIDRAGLSPAHRLIFSRRTLSRSLPCLSSSLLNINSHLAQELFAAAFRRQGKPQFWNNYIFFQIKLKISIRPGLHVELDCT